jgi:hypothetical protein
MWLKDSALIEEVDREGRQEERKEEGKKEAVLNKEKEQESKRGRRLARLFVFAPSEKWINFR